MDSTTYSKIIKASEVFRSESMARNYAGTAAKPMWVVLGEGRYVVCTPANASRLERAGFEII